MSKTLNACKPVHLLQTLYTENHRCPKLPAAQRAERPVLHQPAATTPAGRECHRTLPRRGRGGVRRTGLRGPTQCHAEAELDPPLLPPPRLILTERCLWLRSISENNHLGPSLLSVQ